MSARPWTISVLSTDYDLHEYRTAVIRELESRGVTVSAFELPDFPVEPDEHSHDACLAALDRVDIALLIIDARYGGLYFGDKDHSISITQKEFLTVATKQIPYLVFVSEATWEERHKYKTKLSDWRKNHTYSKSKIKKGVPKQEFDQQYTCEHVSSVETIDFVESIQCAYASHNLSNWITQYSDISDLVLKVKGKLGGLSRYFVEQIVCAQRRKLGNRHTSTGFALTLNDVLTSGYYLEPSFEIESGTPENGTSLDQQLQRTLRNNTSVLVCGEAGYGKTTVLAKSYFSHVENFLNQNSYHVPFYLWLKKKSCDYHFSFPTYVSECFVDDLDRECYPYLNLSNISPYFYFDGFDEIAEKMTQNEVEKISASDMFRYPIFLTCRHQYARRYINNFSFSDKFGVRIIIKTWDKAKAQDYIENFCRHKGKSPEFATRVHQLVANNTGLSDILNNPLLVTMLLWIVEENRMQVPETLQTRIQLFDTCVGYLAKRELSRQTLSEAYAKQLVTLWSFASWEVYFCKSKGKVAKLSSLITTLELRLPQMPFKCSDSLFEALFDSVGDQIYGTFHEQFLEFLVANAIFLACQDKKYPYPEFLEIVMRPEINRYFRGLWIESTEKIQTAIVDNLHEQYICNLGDKAPLAVSKRVHAIYHICRFDSPKRFELIDRAFNIENHISVRLSLFFGAIKMGNLEKEQEFYDLLTTDMQYNEANRGYHLAYYSDAVMGDSLPFLDNTQCVWQGTLDALMRHFKSIEEGHYFLRRIELVTIQQFIESRQTIAPLTSEVMHEFSALIDSSRYNRLYPEFQSKIEAAFIALSESVKSFQSP